MPQKDKKSISYCSRAAKFPQKAYMHYVFYSTKEEIIMIYPFESIYKDMDELRHDMIDYIDMWMEEKANGIEIVDSSLIVPITFDKLYPLQKNFWDDPTLHYDAFARLKSFWNAAEKPSLYQLVVTPSWSGKKLVFHAAIPFFVSATDADIGRFMLTSDYPVDERAKYAAIYQFGTPLRFNWKTGELKETTLKNQEIMLN